MVELDALWAQTRLQMGLEVGKRLRYKPVRVQFRPFAGLTSVLRDRGDHYEVRLSDLLIDAPEEVHVSLARDLLARIDGRLQCTRRDRQPYEQWAASAEVQARHDANRRMRGRKRMLAPQGLVHDLDRLFDQLNRDYFEGGLHKPRLGWSLHRSRFLYAHHDPVHDAIVVNRLFDHPRVPEVVVASTLHHEMLHIKFGIGQSPTGRHVYHNREFRAEEQRFAGYAEAQQFLNHLEGGKIRLRFPFKAPAVSPLAPVPAPGMLAEAAPPPAPAPATTQTTLPGTTW